MKARLSKSALNKVRFDRAKSATNVLKAADGKVHKVANGYMRVFTGPQGRQGIVRWRKDGTRWHRTIKRGTRTFNPFGLNKTITVDRGLTRKTFGKNGKTLVETRDVNRSGHHGLPAVADTPNSVHNYRARPHIREVTKTWKSSYPSKKPIVTRKTRDL